MDTKFQLRQAVENRVSARQGYVDGICVVEGERTQYLFLHVNGEGDSVKKWTPENELFSLPEGDFPPFPNPYPVTDTNPTGK